MNTALSHTTETRPTVQSVEHGKVGLFEHGRKVSAEYAAITPAVTGIIANKEFALFLATDTGFHAPTILRTLRFTQRSTASHNRVRRRNYNSSVFFNAPTERSLITTFRTVLQA